MSPRLPAVVAAIVLAVVLGIVLIGGSGDDAADARTGATSSVVVRFAKTGGFVGVDVRTSIRGDRRVTVTARGGAVKRHTVKAATLAALRRTLDAAHFDKPPPVHQTGCADCFIYAITYEGHKVTFDESAIPSRMKRSLAELGRIASGGR